MKNHDNENKKKLTSIVMEYSTWKPAPATRASVTPLPQFEIWEIWIIKFLNNIENTSFNDWRKNHKSTHFWLNQLFLLPLHKRTK
jgi:hypothetical protein